MVDDQLANEDQIVFRDLPVPVAQRLLHHLPQHSVSGGVNST
jgi:hypothetical protein